MNRPNITEGEWKVNGQEIIGNERNGYICTWSGRKANAKAISAVPEMIDALIELGMAAKDCISHMTEDEKRMFHSGQTDSVSYTFTTRHKELRKALEELKKAGVEL